MTDNEIIKALEDIIKHLDFTQIKSGENVIANALDLINRLQAENERLSNFVSEERCREIAREMIPRFVRQAKAEAIKEFAERLKAGLIKGGIYPVLVKNTIDNLVKEMVGGD